MEGFFLFVVGLIAVIAAVRASGIGDIARRQRELDDWARDRWRELAALHDEVRRLRAEVAALKRARVVADGEVPGLGSQVPGAPEPAVVPEEVPVPGSRFPEEPETSVVPETLRAEPAPPSPVAAPAPSLAPDIAAAPQEPVAPSPIEAPAAARSAEPPPIAAKTIKEPEAPGTRDPGAETRGPQPGTRHPRPETSEARPPRPAPPAAPPRTPSKPFDWENLVGVKLFSWIAGIALALAAIYLFKWSVDIGWFTPLRRAVIGVLTGSGLLVACELRVARRYAQTANAMDAAGIAILYSTFFACHALWNLLSTGAVFALMILVTAVAVLLSIRRDSVFIAVLGLLGGFLTPVMLSTGEDRPFGLFGYLLLLNIGLAWVAYHKRWPLLTGLTLVFTTLYQWGWVFRFLDASKLPIGLGIFLLFPIVNTVALVAGGSRDRRDGRFEWAGLTGAALPLLFAMYLAAVPAYSSRPTLFFGFLLLIDLGIAAVTIGRRAWLLHALAAIATVVALDTWFSMSYAPPAWPAILAWTAAFVAVYALTPFVADLLSRPLEEPASGGVYAAGALLSAFPILCALEKATAAPGLLFAVLFALLAFLAWIAMRTARGGVYFLGAFFGIAAEAIWSAKYLEPSRMHAALALYGIFALFYLGVPVIARKRGIRFTSMAVQPILLLAGIGLLLFLAAGTVAGNALWGMALLLAIMNAGIFAESSTNRSPLLSAAGVLLSWFVLLVWWMRAPLASQIVPAMIVVAGFSMLTVGGSLWSRRQVGEESGDFGNGVYLGLVGHLFLAFVATQPSLSIPPWTLFGILAVLDLALLVAAIVIRHGALHIAAIGASAAVLLIWTATARTAPWPDAATAAAMGLAAWSLCCTPLMRRALASLEASRLRSLGGNFAAASLLAIIAAQVIVAIVSSYAAAPSTFFVATCTVVLFAAFLFVTTQERWWTVTLADVIPLSIIVGVWDATAKPELGTQLAFMAAVLATAMLYPVVASRVDRVRTEPSRVAAAVSLLVFLELNAALHHAGYANVIGLLPIVEAALFAALLLFLLRIEEAGQRNIGRIALVAGTALAYVTAAIPLQLEKQWITIGWALETAALAWLYRRLRYDRLLLCVGALGAAVFTRLVLNPAVLSYHARGTVRILNWYLYAYLVSAIAFYAAVALLPRFDDRLRQGLRNALATGGTILLFLLLNIEIADFYSTGPNLAFNFTASLTQDLTYTLGWAAFAIGMLVAGLVFGSRATRIASIALLLVTIVKCFLHDLARLEGLFRVASLVGLAFSVAAVAVLIQKFVMHAEREAA